MIDSLALQLYSLRKMDKPFTEVLRQVAAAGYSGVETVGDHGLSAEAMRALLEEHRLQVCSSHVSLEALEADPRGVSRFNLDIGNDVLVVPSLPAALQGPTKEAWLTAGRRLGDLAERCQAEGTRLLYHNHDVEMQKVEGKLALDWIMAGAEDAPLGLEPDLAWVVRGNEDPVALLERYAGRCPRAHIKDIAPTGENEDEDGWSDIGHGTLNWKKLLSATREAGVQWLVAEHDEPSDGSRFLQRSADFLRTKL